ncbi:MAG: exodeoxyribonuclease VII small subunit [Elainellaceae cyanobacterium]
MNDFPVPPDSAFSPDPASVSERSTERSTERSGENQAIASNSSKLDLPHDWHYEATIAKIEAIITRIELGELELSEVFEQFEIAVSQLRECEEFLGHHQQRMDLLIETLTDDVEGF